MSRKDLLFVPGFVLSVAVVTAVVYGNPLTLEGAKLQEFVGYIVGVLLSAVVILSIAIAAVMGTFRVDRPPTPGGPNESTRETSG